MPRHNNSILLTNPSPPSVDWVNMRSAHPKVTIKHFRILQIVTTIGLIVSISGGSTTNTSPDAGPVEPSTTSKVGVVLYIMSLAGCVVVFIMSIGSIRIIPTSERSLAPGIALAIPFIGARLSYSILVMFLHNHIFSPINGSIIFRVVLSVSTEVIVIAIYLFLGFRLPKLSIDERGPILSRPWKKKKEKKNKKTNHKNKHKSRRMSEEELQEMGDDLEDRGDYHGQN